MTREQLMEKLQAEEVAYLLAHGRGPRYFAMSWQTYYEVLPPRLWYHGIPIYLRTTSDYEVEAR